MVDLFASMSIPERQFRCLIGAVICIEGLIGAGKSTLGASLADFLIKHNLQARFYPEFKHDALLSQYIADMPKYAYSFQVIMVRERLRIYGEASRFAKAGGISIVDRSLIGDFTFASMQKNKGFISEDEWEVYMSLINHDSDTEPSCTLFLKCDPEEAFLRMFRRHINAEIKGYDLDYFQLLDEVYRKSIELVSHPVVKMDWHEDLEVVDYRISDTIVIKVLMEIRKILLAD